MRDSHIEKANTILYLSLEKEAVFVYGKRDSGGTEVNEIVILVR
jgi:hypothetical protein